MDEARGKNLHRQGFYDLNADDSGLVNHHGGGTKSFGSQDDADPAGDSGGGSGQEGKAQPSAGVGVGGEGGKVDSDPSRGYIALPILEHAPINQHDYETNVKPHNERQGLGRKYWDSPRVGIVGAYCWGLSNFGQYLRETVQSGESAASFQGTCVCMVQSALDTVASIINPLREALGRDPIEVPRLPDMGTPFMGQKGAFDLGYDRAGWFWKTATGLALIVGGIGQIARGLGALAQVLGSMGSGGGLIVQIAGGGTTAIGGAVGASGAAAAAGAGGQRTRGAARLPLAARETNDQLTLHDVG
jgi:hypothetical protein